MTIKWVWAALVLLQALGQGLAQEPQVPAELLKPRRRLQGNQITFCVNAAATLFQLDRAIGEAVASTLLLKARFVEVNYTGFGLLDDGDLMTNLFVDLTNNCDAFIGFNLSAAVYPDWLSFSRSYAKVPYVLAVSNPAYKNLRDIPKGKAIGSGLGTAVDAFFGAYNRNLPEGQGWERIPYGDFELMIRRLKQGRLEGALIWAPTLQRIAGGDPEKAGLYIRPTDPVQTVNSNLGIALRSKDVSLRVLLDKAVATIVQDGTVARLLTQQQVTGTPGDAGNIQPSARNIPVWAWVLGVGLVLGLLLLPRRLRRRA